jgi:hypothetical protein
MRTTIQTIRTIATIGSRQGQITTIAFGGCGMRALANALALYSAASSPEGTPTIFARFADKYESGIGVGGSVLQRAVLWLLRGLDELVRSMRRHWLHIDARLSDVMSPAVTSPAATG